MVRLIIHAALVILLTLLTQVGGLAYLLALAIARFLKKYRRNNVWMASAVFLICYGGVSFGSAWMAPHFGRVPLPCFSSEQSTLAMQSPVYCILNRHYVRPELHDLSVRLSAHLDQKYPGTTTLMLDANFPFFNGFPLLPHLSHSDGGKLDLAYFYQTPAGEYLPGRTKSPIGYWAFEEPISGSPQPCADQVTLFTLRWDLRWFEPFTRGYDLEKNRTRAAVEWLVTSGKEAGVSKIFIEPHLVEALGVGSDLIRFQGCRAARHDDHIHVEVRP